MNKCKDCVWGTWYTSNKVYYPFPFCIKENKKVIKDAKKTKEALQPPRLSGTNRGKVL